MDDQKRELSICILFPNLSAVCLQSGSFQGLEGRHEGNCHTKNLCKLEAWSLRQPVRHTYMHPLGSQFLAVCPLFLPVLFLCLICSQICPLLTKASL